MRRNPDRKLERLAGSVLGGMCDREQLSMLATAADLVVRPAGDVVHREAERNHWSYFLLDGNLVVSQHGDPLAVSAPGSFFPTGHSRPATSARATLTAMSDVELLVFRWRELGVALDRVPALAALAAS